MSDSAMVKEVNAEIVQKARALHEKGKPCLMFSYCFDGIIAETTFKELRRLNYICVNYCVDAYHLWFRHCLDGCNYDAIGVAQSFHNADLCRYFPRVLRMPMAIPRPCIVPDFSAERTATCAIIGTRMSYREWVVKRLGGAGLPLSIYGKGWIEEAVENPVLPIPLVRADWLKYVPVLLRPGKVRETAFRVLEHVRDCVRQRRMMGGNDSGGALGPNTRCEGFVRGRLEDVFSRHLVNIGVSHLTGRWTASGRCRRVQGRLRDFETTGSGGFYLVQRHPDLGDTFREGEEVEAWDDLPELTEKARYYVDHPSEALAIAQRGHARCLASHTWQHRFEEILNVLA